MVRKAVALRDVQVQCVRPVRPAAAPPASATTEPTKELRFERTWRHCSGGMLFLVQRQVSCCTLCYVQVQSMPPMRRHASGRRSGCAGRAGGCSVSAATGGGGNRDTSSNGDVGGACSGRRH